MSSQMPLGGKLLRGNPDHLMGLVVAYVSFDKDGERRFLAVTGDYRKHANLKEFLKAELGDDVDKIRENPDFEFDEDENKRAMLERLRDVPDMEVVPVPAKLIPFAREEQIKSMEGDLVWLGHFTKAENAQLLATVFPIMYQAAFRDQEAKLLNSEIDQLLFDASNDVSDLAAKTYLNFKGDLVQHLLTEHIPLLVDAWGKVDFDVHWIHFLDFMAGYRPEKDIRQIKELLPRITKTQPRKHLELICRKISAIKEERFDMVEIIDDLIEHIYDL